MLKNIENSKQLAVLNKASPLQHEYKSDNLGIQRKNMHLNHKEILSIKLQQGLPQITSPYLKQTISNMFSHKKLRQLEPLIQERSSKERNQFKAQMVKNMTQSIKVGVITQAKIKDRKNRQTKIETKIFNSEHLAPPKILNNVSLSRNQNDYLDLGLIDLKKSVQFRQNLHKKSKERSRKNSRAHTQQSQHSQQTSKVIFKKLEQLHQKQSHLSLSPGEKQSLFFKPFTKQLKSPGFVMRQKFSKELYGQQRQQLKLVNELLASEKGLNLSKGIKVKNYTKFLPRIINIED